MKSAVWLSWDRHRRSVELARALGVPLVVIDRGPRWADPWVPAIRTIAWLRRNRPSAVIVQNPSLVLSTIAALFKDRWGYRLLQDLHSYFVQHIDATSGVRGTIYQRLSRYCIRRADATIVTNAPLIAVIKRHGGRALVLQDKIPAWPAARRPLGPAFHVAFICTFSADEPIDAVLDAARLLPPNITIHITGRPKGRWAKAALPPNARFTGFLPDRDYAEFVASVDAVLGLTTREHTLLCAAYEALAAGKPLVLSDTAALRGYFDSGTTFVRNEATSIAAGLLFTRENAERLAADAEQFVRDAEGPWQERFEAVRRRLNGEAPTADRRRGAAAPAAGGAR